MAGGADFEAEFDAAKGFLGTVILMPGPGKSDFDPDVPTLDGPDSGVDIAENLKEIAKGKRYMLRNQPLDETGSYQFLANNEGDTGNARALVILRRAPGKKRRLVELPSGESSSTALSGTILASNDSLGLAGVGIIISKPGNQAPAFATGEVLGTSVTDSVGNFIVQDLPAGDVVVSINGTTTTNGPIGAAFGTLQIMATVTGEGPADIPQPIVLPDMNNPAGAFDEVSVDGDGKSIGPIDASSGTGLNLGLDGGAGVLILLDGAPAGEDVDLSVIPVPSDEVPMPLLDELGNPLDASSYASVQPPNAQFDATGGGSLLGLPAGLDITFPNERDFPLGTLVDVWSFDHDTEAWVNRSQQTGSQGEVVSDGKGGTMIFAEGVILKGGWHAPVLPVDPACATKVVGYVRDAETNAPLARVMLATSLGQFTSTDETGRFELVSVPAYGLPSNPCVPAGFELTAVGPPDVGAVNVVSAVSQGQVVPGGCTDVGTILMTAPKKGNMVCQVTQNGAKIVGGEVLVEGPLAFSATTDDKGQFFRSCLPKGSYTASYTFEGDKLPTVVIFEIKAFTLSTINLQASGGGGTKTVTVCVVANDDNMNTPWTPVANAKVMLVGKDAASSGGIQGVTNTSGQVTFQKVNPPYTITAQKDVTLFEGGEFQTARVAMSVVGITPVGSKYTLPMPLDTEDEGNDKPDATATIRVANPSVDLGGGPGDSETGAFMEVFLFPVHGDNPIGTGFQGTDGEGNAVYFADISSGDDFHVVVRQRESFSTDDDPGVKGSLYINGTVAALIETQVEGVGPGQSLDVLVDFAQAIPFDRKVTLQIQAPESGQGFLHQGLDLYNSLQGVDEVWLGEWFVESNDHSSAPLPAEVYLPDPNHPALNGYVMKFWSEVYEGNGFGFAGKGGNEFFSRSVGCDVTYANGPAKLVVPLPKQFVEITSLDHQEALEPSELDGALTYLDRILNKTRGFTLLSFDSEEVDEELGVDITYWEFVLPGGLDSFTLPPTVLPMFGENGYYEVCLEAESYTGQNADLGPLLSGSNAEQKLDDLFLKSEVSCTNSICIGMPLGEGKGEP